MSWLSAGHPLLHIERMAGSRLLDVPDWLKLKKCPVDF
jgi:hypothetical protein